MQLTWSSYYIALYVFNLFCFFYFVTFRIPHKLFLKLSISNLYVYVRKYNNNYYLLLFIILVLTGLPPVSLFFVKFNVLISVFKHQHYLTFFILFFFFFSSTLYYTQIFKLKNYKIRLSFQIDDVVKTDSLSWEYQNISSYVYTYILILYLFIALICLPFFIDFFLIFNNDCI